MPSNAELFINHLDRLTGNTEPIIRRIELVRLRCGPVFVFTYKNWPEEGFITGFTFGVSEANHPEWRLGRPELMISIESLDESWCLAIGYIADQLRGKCPFCYGETIDFHARNIRANRNWTPFLVFGPPYLTKENKSVEAKRFGMWLIARHVADVLRRDRDCTARSASKSSGISTDGTR